MGKKKRPLLCTGGISFLVYLIALETSLELTRAPAFTILVFEKLSGLRVRGANSPRSSPSLSFRTKSSRFPSAIDF